MTLDVVTFGCRLNTAESDQIRRVATNAGVTDTVVFNTCAVTAEAVRQARQAIRRTRRERPQARIVVTGCAAQTEPATFSAMLEVDHVLGMRKKHAEHPGIPRSAWLGSSRTNVGDIFAPAEEILAPAVAEVARTRAFLRIQTGCDHRCTFCIIPLGRGNSRSVPPDRVVAEVRRLTMEGFAEVVLTGVDITAYGPDLSNDLRLGIVVRRILREVPELPRLRLSSIDSVEVDHDLLDALAEEPRLMPHLHLSLQSGDDIILKRMKRRHSRADAVAFVEGVLRLRPDTVFGADLIAGFPTETEEQFRRSVDLVTDCAITHLHVFPYSARPGTPAARMPQVPTATMNERAARLREAGREALRNHLGTHLGRIANVLMENTSFGRTEGSTPVRFSTAAGERGTIVRARMTAHSNDAFLAEAA